MTNALYRSETLEFDAHMTNGVPGARARLNVSLYDNGSLQLYMDLGIAIAMLYPDAAALRRLGEFLVAAADGAEAATINPAQAA